MSSTLLDQITAAVADEYAVVGQLGESSHGSAFLARERAGGHLVVLAVPPSADELTVLAAVGAEVPANAGACTACGTPPPTFTAACPTCGRAFVLSAVDAHRFTAAEVQAAAAHAYDVLGEVAHEAGGSLFFVRDRADGRLVALAGRTDDRGTQALEAVWDAIRGDPSVLSPLTPVDSATQPAAGAPQSSFAHFDAPAFAAPAFATPSAVEGGGPGALDAEQPPGYPPDYRPAAPVDEQGALPRRRRWVPLAAAATVVLAAGGAWAAMRGAQHAPTPPPGPTGPPTPPDSTGLVGPSRPRTDSLPVVPPVGPIARDVAPPPNDSAARVAREARRQADSAARALTAPALVTLDGSLPNGWTWTVNGRPGPASMTTRLRPNRPVTISIEAPGYCPEVLQFPSLAPGSAQRWTPRLRGKPMVGEC